MNGIDISNWQAGLNAATIPGDFIIIKATEGNNYVNPSCDKHFQQAAGAGKKLGVYHFARNSRNSAESEAQHFVNNVKGYIKKAILVLDWEDATGDVAWAKAWLDKVTVLTGVRPMIYMSESVVNSHDWSSVVSGNYGLWVAKYRDNANDFNYDMATAGTLPSVKWWQGFAMWQWTSAGRLNGYDGNLDCNKFYGDKTAWDKYAGGAPGGTPGVVVPPAPAPAPAPAPSNTYTVRSGDTLSAIATRFGTSWQNLAAMNGIQNANLIYPGQVLRVPGGVVQAPKTYTVQRGDYLSSIAARYNTTWMKLQQLNGLANPNVIFPGQVLRLP